MRVLVTGDSWAAGEWSTDESGQHKFDPVLVQLLTADGHTVIHRPHPGGNDLQSLDSIVEHYHEVDRIIMFKTETCRSIPWQWNKKTYDSIAGSDWPKFDRLADPGILDTVPQSIAAEIESAGFGELVSFLKVLVETKDLDIAFVQLQRDLLYRKLTPYQDKIVLVGGLEKLKEGAFHSASFHGKIDSVVDIALDCTTHLGFSIHAQNAVTAKELLNIFFVGESDYFNQVEYLFSLMQNTDANGRYLRSQPGYFYPDGVHPNRAAILKYYQHIKEIM